MIAPPSWRLVCYDTLPSTSDHCIARAQDGEPEGLAVLARSQSRARGSRGRSWSEAAGTLALSILLRPASPSRLWPLLAGIAFHDALALTPAHAAAIRLKWPNDLMLHERKLGGILIEADPQPGGWLVIGFGANLSQAPALAERQAACLAELGPVRAAEDIAERLLASLSRLSVARAPAALLRRQWLERAHPAGTKLAVRAADRQTTGSFVSITEDGTLLLDVAGELRRFNTGEVLLLQGA